PGITEQRSSSAGGASMNAILSLLTSFWASLAGWVAKSAMWASVLAIIGPLGPIISGTAQLIGSVITAICEIVVSLSKSAEGRVVLAMVAAGLSFLYLRFHYIEEGKSLARAKVMAMRKPCVAAFPERPRR